jgi:hypothetical protein
MTKNCVNCGRKFIKGKGKPKGKYECCCSRECWLKFNGVTEEDIYEGKDDYKVNLRKY